MKDEKMLAENYSLKVEKKTFSVSIKRNLNNTQKYFVLNKDFRFILRLFYDEVLFPAKKIFMINFHISNES